MDRAFKNIAIYVLIVLLALFAVKLTSTPPTKAQALTYSQFYAQVQEGQVVSARAEVDDLVYNISADMQNGAKVTVTAPKEGDIIKVMQENNVLLDTPPVKPPAWWAGLLSYLIPMVLLGFFLVFIMNQTQGGGNKVMQFGRSKARLMTGEDVKTTFKDVAGAEEAKEEMTEVVEFLKNPQKFI